MTMIKNKNNDKKMIIFFKKCHCLNPVIARVSDI